MRVTDAVRGSYGPSLGSRPARSRKWPKVALLEGHPIIERRSPIQH